MCVFCYLACVMCNKPADRFWVLCLLFDSSNHLSSPSPIFYCQPLSQITRKHTHTHTHTRAHTRTHTDRDRKSWVTFGVKWFSLVVFLLLPPFSCPLLPPSSVSRAVVEKYLLEKSRLVSREKNERWVETGRVLTLHPYWPSWGPLYKHEKAPMFAYEVQSRASDFRFWLYIHLAKHLLTYLHGFCNQESLSLYTSPLHDHVDTAC